MGCADLRPRTDKKRHPSQLLGYNTIVWHASCLVPPLPFPLRQQDETVCSEECWTELLQATLAAGGTTPQREAPGTTKKFLLRTPQGTSKRPPMYPIFSPRPHTQVQVNDPCPLPMPHRASTTSLTPRRAHQRSKRDLPPPPDAPPRENDGSRHLRTTTTTLDSDGAIPPTEEEAEATPKGGHQGGGYTHCLCPLRQRETRPQVQYLNAGPSLSHHPGHQSSRDDRRTSSS
jgi:hypothetical protein